MKLPVEVRQTALMLDFPNFLQRTVLHEVGLAVLVLKLQFVDFAHLAICVQLTVWTIAPLLIQLAKLFRVAGFGRVYLPVVDIAWLHSVLYDAILCWKAVQTFE